MELLCYYILDTEMRALRFIEKKKKRFERTAALLFKGSYFLFVLLGSAIYDSVASLKKVSAVLSSSSSDIIADPDQLVEQIWICCLDGCSGSMDSVPAPAPANVTKAYHHK